MSGSPVEPTGGAAKLTSVFGKLNVHVLSGCSKCNAGVDIGTCQSHTLSRRYECGRVQSADRALQSHTYRLCPPPSEPLRAWRPGRPRPPPKRQTATWRRHQRIKDIRRNDVRFFLLSARGLFVAKKIIN